MIIDTHLNYTYIKNINMSIKYKKRLVLILTSKRCLLLRKLPLVLKECIKSFLSFRDAFNLSMLIKCSSPRRSLLTSRDILQLANSFMKEKS